MDLKTIKRLLNQQTGSHSPLYFHLKERIDKKKYDYHELPYPEEFLIFEEEYLMIAKHLILENNALAVVDIGCHLGIQSELFKDHFPYIGIDVHQADFFNQGEKNVSYVAGKFPDCHIDLKNKVVISSMSLGFFYEDDFKDIAKALSKAKKVFFLGETELANEIGLHFNKKHSFEPVTNLRNLWLFQ